MKELSKYNQAMLVAYKRGYRVNKKGETLNPKNKIISGVVVTDPRGHRTRKHNIKIKGKHASFKAHRLQAYQKFGDKIFEEGMIVRHLDDNAIDNSWDNIAIGTRSDNLRDSYRNNRR